MYPVAKGANVSKVKSDANRNNAKKSTGPNNTTSTRFNATKHGLLSVGITELDNADDYCDALRNLINEKDPQGRVETFLVECAALDMIRLRRARRMEAEYITEALNPPIYGPGPLGNLGQFDVGPLVDPGLPATMHYKGVQRLVNTFQRYETAIALRLSRTLHELERVQRMRKGEQVPAPAAVDVTVTTHTGMADEPSEKVVLEGSLSKDPHKPGEPDSVTAAAENEAADPPVDPPVEN
jgi:hypothetical protein